MTELRPAPAEDHVPGASLGGHLTRRQALTLGAAAGLAAMFGRIATSSASTGADPHLSRASYLPLVGQSFTIAGSSLVLLAVSDLDHLAGRDDAFRLDFAGDPGAADGGIQQFGQKALGTFELFVTPVCAVDNGVQHYEVVIDRSVKLPGDPAAAAPKPDAQAATGTDGTGDGSTGAAPAAPAAETNAPARKPVIRRKRRRKVSRAVAKAKAKAKKRSAAATRRTAAARRRRRLSSRLRR